MYCPKQVPMIAHSSSTKIWRQIDAWKRCLNGSTITVQAPTSDPKLAAMGNQINLHHCFTCACSLSNKAGPAVEKAVIMQENRETSSLIAKPLQHLLHAVCKFRTTS